MLIDKCQDLFNDQAVQAEDIFSSDITRQKRATQLYKSVLDTKTKLEEEQEVDELKWFPDVYHC